MASFIQVYIFILRISEKTGTLFIMDTQQITTEPLLFENHSVQTITRLRQAIVAILSTIPEVSSQRPVDLATGLNIDTKLAWKIAKLIEGADPFVAAQYIPGSAGIQIFLRAATRRNVSKALLASARAAFNSFNDLVLTHAGSRKAFDMMLAGHSRANSVRADLDHRRQMFEGASYIWGVQARVASRLDIVAPSPDRTMFDQIAIRGFVDLRRLRPRVPWRISRSFSSDQDGVANESFSREPLEPNGGNGNGLEEPPLLTEFCSHPLPVCRRIEGPRGVIEFELVEGAVGNTGVLTCVTGEILRQVEPLFHTAEYFEFSQRFRIRTPSEVSYFDVLLHRDLFGADARPTLCIFSDLFAEQMGALYRDCDLLPVREELEYLGTGTEILSNQDFAHTPDIARFAMKRVGWNPAEFNAFRLRMEYPPIPTSMVISHDLPEPPESAS